MKKLLILVLMLCSTFAFAYNIRVLGSVHYFELGRSTFQNITVSVDVSGNVTLDADLFTYQLTTAEKDALVAMLNDCLRLISIAETNKTTIDYQKDLKPVYMSIGNGYIYGTFTTSGYEKSGMEISVIDGGRNLLMDIGKQDISDLAVILNKATSEQADIERQIKLFEQ
jgi:hypothetical protein